MISWVKDIVKNATAFLTTGTAPPNTPPEKKEQLEDMNHFKSRKFFVVFTSIAVITVFYYTSVGILFLIPGGAPEVFGAYTTMFTKVTEILAIIIASYLGCQSIVDFKFNSNSNASMESVTETRKEDIHVEEKYEEVITTNVKDDDYELK